MKNIVKAVFTLTFFSIIDRVLGFIFKIYLSRELGAANLGIYQVALSIFFMLTTVTTSGLPLVVSKLTAKFHTLKDKKSEQSVVSAALVIGVVSSIIICGALYLCRKPISHVFASPQSMIILVILLPGVIFSGVYAGFRGNLWGHEKYGAISVIEVLEQITRIMICVTLFSFGLDKLKMTAVSLSISCGITMILCAIYFFCYRGRLSSPIKQLVPLFKSSAPITVMRVSASLVSSLIAIVVPFLLRVQGNTNEQAMYLFGASIGMALPLLYIPITVVGSLSYVMIPSLSAAYSSGNTKSMRNQIETALTFSIVVAALFVPAFWALGSPIGIFIYDNPESGKFLSRAAFLLIPLSVESIASSMLNSLDLEKSGFVNYLLGAVGLFCVLFSFVKSFSIDILIIGLGLSWTIASILDIRNMVKKVGIRLSFLAPLAKSIALIFPATLLTKVVFNLCALFPIWAGIIISGLSGFIFMFSLSIVFGTLNISVIRSKSPRKLLKA